MKNKMINGKWLGTILAVGLIASLLLASCAPAMEITPLGREKVVEIGDLAILTGAGGSAEQPCYMGRMDYVRYFNEEKGVPGVTISAVWIDTGLQMARFMSGYRMLVDRGIPIIFSNDSNAVETLGAKFEKDQIPFITGAATASTICPPRWVFPATSTFAEATTAVFDYFMENWEEESPPKLQFFVVDSSFGWAAADEGTKYAESIGFEILPIELCSHTVVDATPNLLRIEEREADLVYLQNIITAAGPIMRDVERLNLQDKIQFSGSEWAFGEVLMQMAPLGTEGFLAGKYLPWFDETEVPGIKTMIDAQQMYHGNVQEKPEYIGGWVYSAIMCEAVRLAVEEVGYENLDGPALRTALESMRDFDVDGLVKITYGPERRRGSRMLATYQIQGGEIVRVSDWREAPILESCQ